MLQDLVDGAYEYAYPLFAIASTRHRALHDPGNPDRHAPNTVQHLRELSDHRSRWITAPNNDTLYSNAWLDLSAGPVHLQVDRQPAGRYWSLAFMDAYSNHIAIAGQRLDGEGPVTLTVLGPDTADLEPGPSPGRSIKAPGRDVWLFCRWLVDGPDDLPAARAMQDRLHVQGPRADLPAPRTVPRDATHPANFLAVVNEALARNPPPPADAPLLARWARVGLAAGAIEAWSTLDDAARQAWQARIGNLAQALRQAGQRGRREVQGWMTASADIGNFGSNHALRASVALGGLGALEPIEAVYFVRYVDDEGQALDGRRRYRLRVPPQGIPTDSFWSFTMYQAMPDGRRFFVDNPLGRYAVGNRTPALPWQPDGSLDILLQHDGPGPDVQGTPCYWLPAPAGPFQIALRAYLPRPELREGRAAMPTITRSSA